VPTDPDLLALAAIVRLLFREVATIKRPQDPDGEFERLRNGLLERIARIRIEDRPDMDRETIRKVMLEAVMRILETTDGVIH